MEVIWIVKPAVVEKKVTDLMREGIREVRIADRGAAVVIHNPGQVGATGYAPGGGRKVPHVVVGNRVSGRAIGGPELVDLSKAIYVHGKRHIVVCGIDIAGAQH